MAVLPVLLFAAVYTVIEDQSPLRAACEPSAETIGKLPQGAQVEIRFALSGELGTCYKISAGALTGYVPANALRGTGEFERERNAAPTFDAPRAAPQLPPTKGGGDQVTQASRLLSSNQPERALTLL